jgi:hypothetical protein
MLYVIFQASRAAANEMNGVGRIGQAQGCLCRRKLATGVMLLFARKI